MFLIFLDKDNYLKDFDNWNLDIANTIAKSENVFLTLDHLLVIKSLRSFYKDNKVYPTARIIISLINDLNIGIKDSFFLNKLFPDDPVRKVIKISGLPRYSNCK